MNRDDIIRMAIDAIGGDMNGQDAQHLAWRLEHFKDDSYKFRPDELLKFVSLIAAASASEEREACAQMVLSWAPEFFKYMTQKYAAHCIRARGQS